jgi:putative colanic acid biosynthesis glycosyltransferase WcaI
VKILLINQFFYPDEAATSQFLTDLAAGLRDRGHVVEVICGRTSYSPGAGDGMRGVAVHRVRTLAGGRRSGLFGKAAGYLSFLASAARRLATLPPADVVVVLSTPPMLGVLGVLAKRWGHGRFVYWVQDIYPEIAESFGVLRWKPLNALFQSWMVDVYGAADAVVVLGGDMKQKLLDSYSVSERAEIVHHWPLSEWDGDRDPVRRRLGWDRDFVLLYSGNLGRAHDAQTFLEGFRIFSEAHPEALLVIAGDGHRRAEVEAFAQAHPQLRISRLGHQPREELAGFLAAADVHLVSQRPEADGLVVPSKIYGILESGRPMTFVGSALNEVAALLKKYGIGARVEPGDAAALAAAWEELRRNPTACAQMGKNARQLARGPFSRKTGLARLAGLIEETWNARRIAIE